MESIRLVPAAVGIVFDRESTDSEKYEREYAVLSESDDDALGQWLRASARGDSGDSDPVVLNLIVELYRKIDRLEQLLTHTVPEREPLGYTGRIESIGFEYIKLSEPMLTQGERYYGRIELPIHPKRECAFYFEAVDGSIAKIVRITTRDENEWGACEIRAGHDPSSQGARMNYGIEIA
jgi:hypothetical protein